MSKFLFSVLFSLLPLSALAAPPMPTEWSREEIYAVLKSMPNKTDSILTISTQLDEQYRVQVRRSDTICVLDFSIKRVSSPHGPSDAYVVQSTLIRTSGNMPICQ